MMLDVLREQGPLAHAEIAQAIMERKGLSVGDAVAVKRVTGMVKRAMYRKTRLPHPKPLSLPPRLS